MGLLDKVKNILFDEEEIEIPEIKAEPKKELKKEEENPIKEIKIPKDDFSDREYKSETTFTFPIDFEDEEIVPVKKEVEKPKVREVREQPKRNEKRDYSDFLTDLSVDSTTGRMTKYKNSLPIISGSKGGN